MGPFIWNIYGTIIFMGPFIWNIYGTIIFMGPFIWNKLSNNLRILNAAASFTHNHKKLVLKKA